MSERTYACAECRAPLDEDEAEHCYLGACDGTPLCSSDCGHDDNCARQHYERH